MGVRDGPEHRIRADIGAGPGKFTTLATRGGSEMPKAEYSVVGYNKKVIEGSVNVGNPSQLGARGIMTEICGTKPEYAVMSVSKEGPAEPEDEVEASGLFDALQTLKYRTDQHDDGGLLMPIGADLLETGIQQGDAGHAQLRRRDQRLVETADAQISIPFVEETWPSRWIFLPIEDVAHMFCRWIVAASRFAAGAAGPIRRSLLGRRETLVQRVDRG